MNTYAKNPMTRRKQLRASVSSVRVARPYPYWAGTYKETAATFRSKAGMGRRKIEIKKIENLRTRNSTFKKRRQGILKKAHELATLTDSKVTLSIKNGAAVENHVFNDHLDPLPAKTIPGNQTNTITTVIDAIDTALLGGGGATGLEDTKAVEDVSEHVLTWPVSPVDSGYQHSIDSILDPLALSVTNELCGYSLDLNTSTPSLGMYDSALPQDSLKDPFLNVENYDDCNWLLPWLEWSPNVTSLALA